MEPFLSELPYHIYDRLIISLKDFCIVIRKWPTFLPSNLQPNGPNPKLNTKSNPKPNPNPKPRLAPTWQYFGTITCDGLHGIMKLYIDKH